VALKRAVGKEGILAKKKDNTDKNYQGVVTL
jgi:hypothetical protein